LTDTARQQIIAAAGDSPNGWLNTPLQSLSGEPRRVVAAELGRMVLTAVYRQVLLSVISELWVEYLTQMESLRISIGLEAYAQRDPLVQYKNKAFELFQELLSNMRLSVVSRMFTYRPREISSIQTGFERSQSGEGAEEAYLEEETGRAEMVAEQISGGAHVEDGAAAPQPAAASQPASAPPTAEEKSQAGGGKRKRKRKR
jgi:preprotein translocase subunit SecA